MKVLPDGISSEDLDQWTDCTDPDPRKWTVKSGAPERVVKAFPEFVDTYMTPDNIFIPPNSEGARLAHLNTIMQSAVDEAVGLTNTAQQLRETAAAKGMDQEFVEQLAVHEKNATLLYHHLNDALLGRPNMFGDQGIFGQSTQNTETENK